MDPANAKRRSGVSVIDQQRSFRVQLVEERPVLPRLESTPQQHQPRSSWESSQHQHQSRSSLESPFMSPRVISPRVRTRTGSITSPPGYKKYNVTLQEFLGEWFMYCKSM